MRQYLDLLKEVWHEGVVKSDRTGTGTRSLFGRQLRFDLSDGFPILTTKRVFWKGVVFELLFFLRGDTNIKYLNDRGVHIWDEWSDENGELGPVYGAQWRRWATPNGPVDQIEAVVRELRANPESRRMVVSAWNVFDLPEMRLAPCHCLFQFYTRELSAVQRASIALKQATGEDYREPRSRLTGESVENFVQADWDDILDDFRVPHRALDLQLYQRSADLFLGVPFNIASYALLTHLVAAHVGMVPGEFIHTLGDVHLYLNHETQVKEQLTRHPDFLPKLVVNPRVPRLSDLAEVEFEDLELIDYHPQPAISAPVAV